MSIDPSYIVQETATEPSLRGNIALVTGAGSGIGRALSWALAQRAATVYAMGRTPAPLQELKQAADDEKLDIRPVTGDVSNADTISTHVDTIFSAHQRIDFLINNAGIMYLGAVADAEFADWAAMVQTNLLGTLTTTRFVLPHMLTRRHGDILNISSISARGVGPGTAVYAATKKAIEVISDGMRQELAGTGVRVGYLQLGGVATGLNEKIRDSSMRKLIKLRSNSYHELPAAAVADEIVHMLTRPRFMNIGMSFIVPSDQAS